MTAAGVRRKLGLLCLIGCLWGCTPAVRLAEPPGPPPWQQVEHYLPGNAVQVLTDGPATYRAMHQAIAEARHHVHVQTYILCDDQVGREFAALLAARRRAGVVVRLMYDHHGTLPCSSQAFLDGLAEQGLELLALRPPPGSELVYPYDYQHRDHRKLLIVDGRVAFVGGINFNDAYATSSAANRRRDEGWRDTNIRIEGPAVAQFQALFLARWRMRRPLPDLPDQQFFPPLEPVGDAAIRAVESIGGSGRNDIYRAYVDAIRHAQRRIWLTHSYFTPEPALMTALIAAARRGVDVRLLLPGFSDVPLTYPIARSTYGRLLEAGVRVYERRDAFIHAKTAVIDGRWSTVGAANLDYRSLLHNDEVNAMIIDRQVAEQMEQLFLRDIAQAEPVDLERWRRRPLAQRLKEWLGLVFAYWL